eukprot:5477712-Amphidinium_carterae.1
MCQSEPKTRLKSQQRTQHGKCVQVLFLAFRTSTRQFSKTQSNTAKKTRLQGWLHYARTNLSIFFPQTSANQPSTFCTQVPSDVQVATAASRGNRCEVPHACAGLDLLDRCGEVLHDGCSI